AVRGAIRYMLLFPALEGECLLPVVGIWPAIRERMTRPKAEAPAAGGLPEGFSVYDVPLLLHDMTAILVAASGEGLRLKADGASLFKKEEAALEERMLDCPPAGCGYQPPSYGRIDYAHNWLAGMKLVAVRGKKKEKRLAASEKGRAWLAGADGERLKALHEHMHAARKRHATDRWSHYHEIAFVPHNPQSHVSTGAMNLEDSVAKAFAECPVGEWIGLDDFLKWQAESENPFMLSLDASIERIFYSSWSSTDSFREERWRGLLSDFMYERLLLLGGIRLAFNGEGDVRFSMTPTGAYLIGARDGFEYAVKSAAGGVLVQPDFEIIFTAPNPHAESELTRFAKRIGNGVGALFRITRPSVFSALDTGQTGEQICAVLEAQCATAVPANVVKQIQGWSQAFRRVAIRQIQVVECPDAETALLVCGLFPKKVSRLTDTLVQIEGTNKTLEPLKKKLRQNGIGII
ncbi:MAG: helicase-associated domain-containing protein, partial [Verrucomicrobiota bacterium]|nr:helicase-associated domain-containing protein [Verrucomicrobiota bacterium]